MNTETKEVKLLLNGVQVVDEIKKITTHVETLKKKKQEAWDRGDLKEVKKLAKEIDINERKLKTFQNQVTTLSKVMKDVTGKSARELTLTIKTLQRELNSGYIQRGSELWKQYATTINQAKDELKRLKHEQELLGRPQTLETLKNLSLSYLGIKTALSQLSHLMEAPAKTFAAFESAMVDVVKYTGLAKEEVENLNEAFKKIDTGTSREQLNALAGDAGRLGINSKEKILEFVDAANQINVALGADLGEDAVKNIGKLAQMFGDDEEKGLKKAMLSTASAINTLGMSSSASEPYLVEFLARVAGAGKQAGLSQAQILGFASTLDQNMMGVEKSATAFQRVLIEMYSRPQEFAKIAGLEVRAFAKLMKENANEGLLKFFEGLNKKGDLSQLATIFSNMGMEGSGVVQMLTTMAGKIETAKQQQELANNAYSKAISVTNEYNTRNQALTETLKKQEKARKDAEEQLGRHLFPIYTKLLNITNSSISTTASLVKFIANNAAAFGTLATATAIYFAILYKTELLKKGALITDKLSLGLSKAKAIQTGVENLALYARASILQALKIKTYEAATMQRMYNAAMASNPAMALVSVLLTLVGVLALVTKNTNKATQAQIDLANKQRLLNSIEKEAKRTINEKEAQLRILQRVLNDNNKSLSERETALKKLKALAPTYQATLTKEGELINNNTAALSQYLEKLKEEARAKAARDKLQTLEKKRLNAELTLSQEKKDLQERQKLVEEYNKLGNTAPIMGTAGVNFIAKSNATLSDKGVKAKQELEQTAKDIATLEAYINSKKIKVLSDTNTTTAPEVVTPASNTTTTKTTTTTKGGKIDYTLIDKERETSLYKAKADYAIGLINYEEYLNKEAEITSTYFESKKEKAKNNSDELKRITNEEEKAKKESQTKFQAWSIEEAEKETKVKEDLLHKENLSVEALTEEKFKIAYELQKKKLNLAKETADPERIHKEEKELAELLYKHKLERENQFLETIKNLRKEQAKKSQTEVLSEELQLLEEANKRKLISEEEYLLLKGALNKKYKEENYKEKAKANHRPDEILNDVGYNKVETKPDGIGGALITASKEIIERQKANEKLKELEQNGLISHKEYLDAKKRMDEDYGAHLINIIGGAYETTNAIMQNVSSYFQADQEIQIAQLKNRYDKEIQMYGETTAKGKEIKAKQEKEIAKIKQEANKKAMAMEMAQAVAGTAMAAINALASGSKLSPIVGAIAMASALAAGAIQIATIKKQHEAQAQGYYKGGFTGGKNYYKEAGVVHEGEFVINHKGVNNPKLMPFLQMIDKAQKDNTISSLSLDDVSKQINPSYQLNQIFQQTAQPQAPIIIDNSSTNETLEKLNDKLEKGIQAFVTIDGPQGFEQTYNHYKKLTS